MTSSISQACIVPDHFCIRLAGPDARKIANNLTTNDIAKLEPGNACETFVTNVKGWAVAHGLLSCQPCQPNADTSSECFWLVGQHPTPQTVAEHIDRYIFREDAEVTDHTSERSLLAVLGTPNAADLTDTMTCIGPTWADDFLYVLTHELISAESLADHGMTVMDSSEFELRRIRAGWPKQDAELHEKTIPQEMDRDAQAISFTKGCYLGQETIARLDALGQLQRKLCLLIRESDTSTDVGDEIIRDGKTVGLVSSLAQDARGAAALATLKRGSFAAGTEVAIGDETWTVAAPVLATEGEA